MTGILTHLRLRIAGSLRYKLLLLVLFPIVLFMPVMLGLAAYWTQQFSYNQLYQKVNTDLSVAHDVFHRLQQDHLALLKSLAESYAFRTALEQGEAQRLRDQLHALRATSGFDFLHITDLNGHWLFEPVGAPASESKSSPLQEKAQQTGAGAVGVEVFSQAQLRRESDALAERAEIPLLSTPRAAPTDRKTETRGMVLRVVYPVKDLDGSIVALLDGGVLLNRNFSFVDRIRDLVYGPGSLQAGAWGAVTVFLDDVRISTNVPLARGERAIGTRVSRSVRDAVLGHGKTWIARAFVVNDWYISGYEPIVDVTGQRVGMLYSGFIEQPYRDIYWQAVGGLVAIAILSMVFAAVLAVRGATTIFRPIEAMANVVQAEQAGEERRIGTVASRDEIGELARQFDAMLDLLQERNRQIRAAADSLEAKVDERTRELQEQNVRLASTIKLLRETRQQLVMAEKLAALGELTAGVAHEVNNPVAVILGNLEIMVHELGEHARPVQTEIDLIMQQIVRIQSIVDQLLRYSRPGHYTPLVESVDVDKVVDSTLLLVRHELKRKEIRVETRHAAHNRVRINPQELQQVLVNLVINAIHAVETGGQIELATRDWQHQGVVVSVKDNGRGIPRDQLGRIFEPFYTTNRQGTGLGLSVSYSLIRRYGGHIAVRSAEGEWTRFDVYLRTVPVFSDDDEVVMARHVDAS